MKDKLSVIIPMHNASDHIEKCLSSISKQTAKDFEVIVVDDGSTDDSIQKATKFPVRIVHIKDGGCAAKARNLGAKNASGNIFVFIDSDIVLKPDTIEKTSTEISKPDTDVVSGIYTEDTPVSGFFSHLQNLILVYRFLHVPKIVTFTNSAFCAIKRKAFEAIGGYNEKMRYYEDIEFGHRVTKKGYVCKMDTNLNVTHLKYFNHLGLVRDYFKKAVASGVYKRRQFSRNIKSDELQWYIKISGVSTGFVLISIFLVWFSIVPLLVSLAIYSVFLSPLLFFLVKTRNLIFAIRSYFVCFEIFLVSLLALVYGTLVGGLNG